MLLLYKRNPTQHDSIVSITTYDARRVVSLPVLACFVHAQLRSHRHAPDSLRGRGCPQEAVTRGSSHRRALRTRSGPRASRVPGPPGSPGARPTGPPGAPSGRPGLGAAMGGCLEGVGREVAGSPARPTEPGGRGTGCSCGCHGAMRGAGRAVAAWRLLRRSACVPIHGRSMLPTLLGGSELFGSDIVWAVRPDAGMPLWPRVGELVILVDEKGRMVKRLRHLAEEEGASGRGWCWVEGDNPRLSEDSRSFGWAPSHRVESVVLAVSWPLWRARWLLAPERVEEPSPQPRHLLQTMFNFLKRA